MYVNIVISLLGLTAAASSVIANEKQQCNRVVDQQSSIEYPGVESKQTKQQKSDSSINVTDEVKWNSVIMGSNKTVPRGNLSDVDEFMLHGMQNKFSKRKREIIFMEDEDKLKIGADEADFVAALGKKYFSIHAPFNPAYSQKVSPECKRAAKRYLTSLRAMEMWALRMHDSSAKLNSGILNGNVNQFGDYDQCLRISGGEKNNAADQQHLQGQYCLAAIQPAVVSNAVFLQHVLSLAQSRGILTSQLDDPGHRVPRFSTINWALCIPSACSSEDVRKSLDEYLHDQTQGTGLKMEVSIEPESCQKKNTIWERYYTNTTAIVWIGFIVYFGVVVLSTIYECKSETKNEWLTSFSLVRNTKAIFCVKEDPNDVACVHGLRFLNAFLLIVAHKSMALFYNPYINRTRMSEGLGQPWTVIGRAASLFTDPFIMFSGFLTTYSLIGRLMRGQRVKLYQDYIGRILRIAPPLAALILFCTFVLPYISSGPQWNLVVSNHGELCKKYWWRNLMFIHNYFGFKNMCLTHTHHIGIDTELFAVSPLFIYLIWKWPKKGTITLIVIALVTTLHRFYITFKLRLANYVHFGTSVKQLFDTADNMYILPYYRLTVYLMGVMLGYSCRAFKHIRLTPNQLRLGWYVSSFLLALAFFGPAPMGSIHYEYNAFHAANYAAFSPIAWCIFFSWVVFTSHLGYKNTLVNLLSWRGFRVTTKMSYAVYLTQFPIFFYQVGRVRSSLYYDFVITVLCDFNEYGVIFLASYLLTVLFETPYSNIKRLLFDKRREKQTPAPKLHDKQSQLDSALNSSKSIIYSTDPIAKELKDR